MDAYKAGVSVPSHEKLPSGGSRSRTCFGVWWGLLPTDLRDSKAKEGPVGMLRGRGRPQPDVTVTV